MHPDAYRRLDEFGLPRPRAFSATELLALKDVPTVLLRGGYGPGRPGFFSPREAATRLLETGAKEMKADEAIVSDAGGCAVVQGTEFYMELVDGHLSGLLRDGWCNGRFWASKTESSIRKVEQEVAIDYSSLEPSHRRGADVTDALGTPLWPEIKRYCERLPRSTLVEFIVTPALTPVFVDLKPYPWNVDFKKLFSEEEWLYGDQATRVLQWEECPCTSENTRPLRPDAGILLNAGAALCHFITYGLRDKRIVAIRC